MRTQLLHQFDNPIGCEQLLLNNPIKYLFINTVFTNHIQQ